MAQFYKKLFENLVIEYNYFLIEVFSALQLDSFILKSELCSF